MKIVYGKQLTAEESNLCRQIALECGIMYDTARLLFYRNIDTIQKAKEFLNPGKHGFYNPFLLAGMAEAVDRIERAKANGENVLIFGDYDADGICATAVLYYCLKEYGIDARTVVPEREDGYGINVGKILQLNDEEKINLLITVDCGISDCEKIEELKSLGIDVIVTDHHEPPSVLPNCIKINPKIAGQQYPFNGLCGAGVAYKLGVGLIGEKADEFLDFTTLATVADSMDLIDENRHIVVEGLKLFNSNSIREQFKTMLGEKSKNVTAQNLAYNVAPRINAGGRMGDAGLALNLFLCDNKNKIFDYTAKLGEYNLLRQTECDNIYREAKKLIEEKNLEADEIILVENSEWKTGFIGIVAAKLVEDYSRPVIVFAGYENGIFKGSARSIDGVNIYDAISSASDLLSGFGGHSQAAGVSVSVDNLPRLRVRLNEFVKENYGGCDSEKKLYAEWHVQGEFPLRFAREIDMLEPFGVGNKKPLFTTTVNAVESIPLKADSPHYSFKTETVEMLYFNGGADAQKLSLPVDKKILFEANLSTFKSKEYLKGYVKSVVVDYSDFSSLKAYIYSNELEKLKEHEELDLQPADSSLMKNRFGTVFAISDIKNLQAYPELMNLPVKLFSTEGKNSSACVVVSLKEISTGYKNIVYLDKPLATLNFNQKAYLAKDIVGYDWINKLSIDRMEFSQQFVYLKSLVGKKFRNIADFASRYNKETDIAQFVFVLTVFLELGIFYHNNGMFLFDSKMKNPLTNSKVYSKISLLKNS